MGYALPMSTDPLIIENAAFLSEELELAAAAWHGELEPGGLAATTGEIVALSATRLAKSFGGHEAAIDPRELRDILPDYQDAMVELSMALDDDDEADLAKAAADAAIWAEQAAPVVCTIDEETEKAASIFVAGVFRWTGNSTKKVKDLAELVPADGSIKKWIEPCAGSCAIYLGLQKSKPEIFSKCTEIVLNDKDALLIDSLKFLRGLRGEAKAAFLKREWVRSPEQIKQLRQWTTTNKADAVYRFVYLLYSSATRGHIKPPKPQATRTAKSHWLTEMGRKIPIERVLEQAARLRGVKLTNRDAVEVVREYAGDPGALLAVDPPYSKVNNSGDDWVYGQASGVDYEALAKSLRAAKARTFVLIDRSPQQRKRWGAFLKRIFKWKRRDSLAAMQGRGERYYHDEMFANFGKPLAKAADDENEELEKRVVRRGDQFCVLDETSGRSFGCYDTKSEADARLRQIERFEAGAVEKRDLPFGVTVTSQGYVAIKVGASHPLGDSRGYAYLHTLVWRAAGKRLPAKGDRYSGKDSILDHINRKKDDNRLSNLRRMGRGGHAIRTTEDNVRDGIVGSGGKIGARLKMAFDHADTAEHRIVKAGTDEERFILCVVLEPNDGKNGAPLKPDSQGHVYSAEEIYQACHGYMVHHQRHKFQHGKGDIYRGKFLSKDKIQIVENTITRWDGELVDPRGKTQKIYKGTWLQGLILHDDRLWEKAKKGGFKRGIDSLSIGGTAVPVPFEG